jgi:hypothetical protein
VVKHVDAVELRLVVAGKLAVAADAILVAHHPQNLMLIWLSNWPPACAQSRANWQPEGGEHAGKKGGEKRINVRNSVWQFATRNRKCRWRTRLYFERENEVV